MEMDFFDGMEIFLKHLTDHRNCILQYKEEELIKKKKRLSTSCHYLPTSGKCPKISSGLKK